MADPTKPAGGETRPDFETLWQRAQAQPEIVHVDAPKIDIDTSPTGILEPSARDRRGRARRKAELSAADHPVDSVRHERDRARFRGDRPGRSGTPAGRSACQRAGPKGKPK